MSKTEITLNNAAVALLFGETGTVTVVQHGEHRLIRIAGTDEQFAVKAPLSRKNRSMVRFRLAGEAAKALGLVKGKYAVASFDMTKHTARARWARKLPRNGWVAVVAPVVGKVSDTPVLAVL